MEEQIERSKAHWSTLADQSGCMEGEEEEEAEVSNVQVFQALQRHPSGVVSSKHFMEEMMMMVFMI